jgi:hypothetical protein
LGIILLGEGDLSRLNYTFYLNLNVVSERFDFAGRKKAAGRHFGELGHPAGSHVRISLPIQCKPLYKERVGGFQDVVMYVCCSVFNDMRESFGYT